MQLRSLSFLGLFTAGSALAPGCGAAVDHSATLARLRDAIQAPVTSPEVREEHNRIVTEVTEAGALEGLHMHEVQTRIGRGQQCGERELCRAQGFAPHDWVYEVGRDPGDPELPAGPTLVVGFDRQGVVSRTYFLHN